MDKGGRAGATLTPAHHESDTLFSHSFMKFIWKYTPYKVLDRIDGDYVNPRIDLMNGREWMVLTPMDKLRQWSV